jgi:dUTP pyrophosphatase
MITVKIKNDSNNELPKYQTIGSSGVDLQADFSKGINEKLMWGCAWDDERKVLLMFSGGRCIVPTNIKTEIAEGYEAQIRSRSGLAIKDGVIVLNSPGTIDDKKINIF